MHAVHDIARFQPRQIHFNRHLPHHNDMCSLHDTEAKKQTRTHKHAHTHNGPSGYTLL